MVGEDGVEWAYRYRAGDVSQVGVNGYDGSSTATVHSTDAPLPDVARADDLDVAETVEKPPRLRSNMATLCCARPTPAAFGHPAPWTATLSEAPRFPLHADAPTDKNGLFSVVSLLDSDRRTALERDDLVSRLDAGPDQGDRAEISRRLGLTRMVVGVVAACSSFDGAQLDLILHLQVELDALLIYEEAISYRTSAGTELRAEIRY